MNMNKFRLFLVDDHPLVREALRRLLTENEEIAVVGEANSAEEALEQIAVLSPDVVVMDIKLPGMDGVEATRQLKASHPETKVVIVSAFGTEYLLSSIQAGADGYLLKTTAPDDLVNGILRAAHGEPPIDTGLTRHLLDQVSAGGKGSGELSLSARQRELLRLVAEGCSSKEIASELFISQATIKREFRNIFNILGVNDRAHAVAEAYRRNLI